MESAKCASRVGALAFSLGLGVAVATGGGLGVASADTRDGAGAASAGPVATSSHDATAPSEETTTPGNSVTTDNSDAVDAAVEPDPDDEATLDEDPIDDEELVDAGNSAEEVPADEDVATDTPTVDEKVSRSTSNTQPRKSRGEREDSAPTAESVAETPASTPSPVSASASGEPASAPTPDNGSTTEIGTTGNSSTEISTVSVPMPRPVTSEQSVAAPATSIVSRFLAMFGLPSPTSATGGSTTPATPAVMLGMLDWVRRELDRFFSNDLPTPDPRQVVQGTGTGVVVGTLNTTDEENDRLSFIVTDQPKFGKIVVYSNGTYVYTPKKNVTAPMQQAGWSDSFTVRIIDRGFNIRKITDFLRGDAPGVSLPISVTVAGYTGTSPVVPQAQQSLSDGRALAAANDTVTRGYDLINASSQPIRLISYGAHLRNQVTQSPELDSILLPGETHHYEVVYYFLGHGQVNPTYQPVSGGGKWHVQFDVQPFGDGGGRCSVSGPGACNKYGSPMVLMDQPGGQIEIPAGEGQKQAEALNLLCNGSAPATCSFSVKSQDKTVYAKDRQIWNYQTMESQANIEDSAKFSTSTSHSIEISAKAGVTIKSIVELEIAAKYTAKFEETLETVKTIKFVIPPWTHKVLLAEAPVIRYTGDFTVKLGNTTYLLRDVYFDVPDKDRATRYREVSTAVPKPAGV